MNGMRLRATLSRATLPLLVFLALTSAAAIPPAQSGAPTPQKQQGAQTPQPLRVTTRLVHVSAIVTDKHGNPITGLTKSDFVVLDDKKPQDIQVFSVLTNQPLEPPPASPPDTYTDRVLGNGDVPPNITVVLLDGLNTDFADQAFARQQVIKFFEHIQPRDRVALYTLGTELHVLHDFTSDATSLLAALKKYKGHLSSDLPSKTPDAGNTEMALTTGGITGAGIGLNNLFSAFLSNNAREREADFLFRDRVRRTLAALTQIAYHVGSLPGRKNLIWVSGSFPVNPSYMVGGINAADAGILFAKDIEAAAQELNNSALVVYPVYARGLTIGRLPFFDFVSMNVLASETGGRAFYNTNDITGSIRTAINDSRVTYELGYYPAAGSWDGRFHAIKVKVNRPGAHVRARQGYFAVTAMRTTPEMRQAIIAQAATNLIESNRLGVTVNVNSAVTNAKGIRTLNAAVTMDPHQLNLKQENGRFTGAVELIFVELNDQKRIIYSVDQSYQLTLLPATYERPPEQGFTIVQDVVILPDATEMRVVLRDLSTDMTGAVGVPLAKYFPAPPATD
jgi:VWFA-related protein